MTHDEYRTLLAALGLSQVGAAQLLGVDARTSRRWALGERDIPAPAERFLRYIERSKTSPAKVMRLLE